MKIKRILIGIKSLDDTLTDAAKTFELASKGKSTRRKSAIYFSNLKEMRRVLTERRLELLNTVKHHNPSSVYELSKMLNRDLKNVLQDVAYLKELGIMGVTETGDKKIPRVEYDRISIEVAV